MSERPVSSQAATAPSHLISVAEALALIRQQLTPLDSAEQIEVGHALGRVLAKPLNSPIAVPAFDNSAMDGYALRHEDINAEAGTRLRIIGTSYAGTPFMGRVGVNEAVRIMTGAKVPEGADSVVMQEHVEVEGDLLTLAGAVRAGDNIRRCGEEFGVGSGVLAAGRRLSAADIGLLASLGIAEVSVVRRLKVAMFSTGDELRPLGEPLGPGQIYDANRYTLQALLKEFGAEIIDLGIIEDTREAVATAFGQAADLADAVLTSGGVSVGDADYVKETLEQLGEVGLWRIAMKPGKPLAFGRLGDSHFFGLPGNPVSAMVTFREIVLPALRTLQGESERQPLRLQLPAGERLKKRPGRADYQRGIIRYAADGELVVFSTGHQGSHMLSSISSANCLIVLPADSGGVEVGEQVVVEPLDTLL